jgi:hypothetical protein
MTCPSLSCVPQPKRRRSSAQPSLGGAHKTIARTAMQPAVIEESEPEEEDPPLRKVGRNKKRVSERYFRP